MQFFMRFPLTIIILLFFYCSKGQYPTKELKIPEVGWTLFIPIDSKFLDFAHFDTIRKKAIDAINKTYGISDEDFTEMKPLFTIRQGDFNIFWQYHQPL